jgi:putative membrane protein
VPLDFWLWLVKKGERPDMRPYLIILAHVLIAVVYTTPWDNYLVATSVWWYDPELVSGITIGWVPLEEYIFFVLQTMLTGLLTVSLFRYHSHKDRCLPSRPKLNRIGGGIVAGIWFLSTLGLLSGWPSLSYLTLILSWALIPIFLQTVFGLDILIFNSKTVFWSIIPVTVYLWLVDSVALNAGTWTIDPAQTTGLKIGIIPIEEMIFFLMTNLIIVFGVTLMLSPVSQSRLETLIKNLRLRADGLNDRFMRTREINSHERRSSSPGSFRGSESLEQE